jgi:hypothetical protein
MDREIWVSRTEKHIRIDLGKSSLTNKAVLMQVATSLAKIFMTDIDSDSETDMSFYALLFYPSSNIGIKEFESSAKLILQDLSNPPYIPPETPQFSTENYGY